MGQPLTVVLADAEESDRRTEDNRCEAVSKSTEEPQDASIVQTE